MTDKGVTPGLVERAFRRSTWNSYVNRTSQQQAKAGHVEKQTKADKLRSDLEALQAAQDARPKKPPGKQ